MYTWHNGDSLNNEALNIYLELEKNNIIKHCLLSDTTNLNSKRALCKLYPNLVTTLDLKQIALFLGFFLTN